MGNIAILTDDHVFGRMLELELIGAGHSVVRDRGEIDAAPQQTFEPHTHYASRRARLASRQAHDVRRESDAVIIDVDSRKAALSEHDPERTVAVTCEQARADELMSAGAARCFVRPFVVSRLVEAVGELCSTSAAQLASGTTPSERLTVDAENSVALFNGAPLDLTRREFELLACLYASRGTPLSRSELIKRVWRYDFEGNTNVVDVYIRYLREKIDIPFNVKLIETVRGAGYRLN